MWRDVCGALDTTSFPRFICRTLAGPSKDVLIAERISLVAPATPLAVNGWGQHLRER